MSSAFFKMACALASSSADAAPTAKTADPEKVMPSLGNDHFDTNLNAVHWGNFGHLSYYYRLLR